MRLIVIFLFISSACFGQFVRDTDGAYVKWNDMYLVGTQGIIPNPPDPPDPPDPVIPGNFEGIVLYDIDFSEVGTAPFVNSDATARAFWPGVTSGNFARVGSRHVTNPEVDSIVLINGDEAWKITVLPVTSYGNSAYGVGWNINLPEAQFGNMQVDCDILLSSGWDMYDESKGGKLPGFGATDSAGGVPPTSAGFSGYPGEGHSERLAYGIDDEIGTYNYIHQMAPGAYGLSYYPNATNGNGPFVYNPGTWYHLTMRVKHNVVIGLWDGTIEMLLNGVSVMLKTGLKIRGKTDIYFNFLMPQSFAGGTPDEGYPTNNIVWIDNLVYSVPDYNGTIGIGNTLGDENIPYTYTRVE